MATRQPNAVLQHLRRAVLLDGATGMTDAQLLGRFIDQRDEAAFAALVRRHGPMVLSVCRRIVRNCHDADDAFQATFLVLVRKASSVKPREMVANWLYGVAYHTALKARALATRRQAREKQVTAMPEPKMVVRQELDFDLQTLLDQELSRLPDKYRVPIVLCDLEGKSRKEAARQLGWLDGTLSGRLARGRQMLAKRLTQHGFAVSAGVVAVVLSQNAAPASVPASLLVSTVKAASVFAAGQAAGVVSTQVAILAEGVLKTMLFAKLKTVAVVFTVLFAVVGIGLGFSSGLTSITAQDKSQPGVATKQGQEPPVAKEKDKEKNESKPPEPAWKVEFRRAYGLKDGEVLKRVAAPFPACRKEYCQSLKDLFPGSDVDDVIMNYRWDGKNVESWRLSINPDKSKPKGWPLLAVVGALNIPSQEIEMEKELLQMHIEGEFVMRTGAPTEKVVPRLEQILREELKLPLHFTLIQAEREVTVVSGKYESKPRANRKANVVDLFAVKPNDDAGAGGGSGTFDKFLDEAGSYIGRRLVSDLAEKPKAEITWNYHNSTMVLPGPDLNQDADGVLKNITAQTGLTFKTEKRKVRVLIVEKR